MQDREADLNNQVNNLKNKKQEFTESFRSYMTRAGADIEQAERCIQLALSEHTKTDDERMRATKEAQKLNESALQHLNEAYWALSNSIGR